MATATAPSAHTTAIQPPAATDSPAVTTPPVPLDVAQASEANKVVRTHTYWSLGVCLLPFPGLDVLGVAGIQLKMLSELAGVYKIEFKENRAKSIIASLAGSIGTTTLLTGSVASLVKLLPGIGSVAGGVALTAVSGASTYAVGKVFIQHFASGGTFLDFDPVETREYFAEQFKEGKLVVEQHLQKPAKAAAAN